MHILARKSWFVSWKNRLFYFSSGEKLKEELCHVLNVLFRRLENVLKLQKKNPTENLKCVENSYFGHNRQLLSVKEQKDE